MAESEERPQKLRKLDYDASNIAEPAQHAASNSAPAQHDLDEAESAETDSTDSGNHETPKVVPSDDTNKPGNEEDSEISPLKGQNGSDQPVSKNQLKKLRKRQQWEEGREDRKIKRKQKTVEKRERKREARREEEAKHDVTRPQTPPPKPRHQKRLPITIMIDCSFDHLMSEKEMISLGSQITRAYADNSRAQFYAHLVISSWGGKLKERFDTVLAKNYENWKGVKFTSDDFAIASEQAWHNMIGPKGGLLVGVFEEYTCFDDDDERVSPVKIRDPVSGIQVYDARPHGYIAPDSGTTEYPEPTEPVADRSLLNLMQPAEEYENNGEIVYLTSDSPRTLQELNPYSTYIVGGLVDKNRHKGICYKSAREKKVNTAKLPIAEYMEMQSRQVLATNHVVEILLKYLECGDWGDAFMQVIPKRKGGKLRGKEEEEEEGADKEEDEEGADKDEEVAEKGDEDKRKDHEDSGGEELKEPGLGDPSVEDAVD